MCLGNNISRAKVCDLAYTPIIASQLPPSALKDEPSASFIGSGGLSSQRSAAMFVDGIERRGISDWGWATDWEIPRSIDIATHASDDRKAGTPI